MKKKQELAKVLMESADQIGVIPTLVTLFGRRVNMIVPYNNKTYEISIDSLDFSARAMNAMKRSGIFTLGEVIDAVASGALLQIRNLGKKTENEIKTKIMAFSYEQLTLAEKQQFFLTVIEKNEVV